MMYLVSLQNTTPTTMIWWLFSSPWNFRFFFSCYLVLLFCTLRLLPVFFGFIFLQYRKWRCILKCVSYCESPYKLIFSPSVLWHCLLTYGKRIRSVKSWVLVCWWWWFDWSFARFMAAVGTTLLQWNPDWWHSGTTMPVVVILRVVIL